MGRAAFVAEAKLAGGQGTEVLNGLGGLITEESKDDASGSLVVDCDVEEHLVGHWRETYRQVCQGAKGFQPLRGAGPGTQGVARSSI